MDGPEPKKRHPKYTLTQEELRVVEEVMRGRSARQIAAAMGKSPQLVQSRLRSALRKLTQEDGA